MRTQATNQGLTLRVIPGTYNALLAFDLEEERRTGCLGFSVKRTDLGKVGDDAQPEQSRWLPNFLKFPKDPSTTSITTDRAPLQKFRWGDYTLLPGHRYRYEVTAQYQMDGQTLTGQPGELKAGPTVTLDIETIDPVTNKSASVFFNRGAAASQAYNAKFGQADPDKLPPPKRQEALDWLSRGLEQAILDFMKSALDANYALHAAIYEFQKPELLQGLKSAIDRGVDVKVVYHDRQKLSKSDPEGAKDTTGVDNKAAADANGLAEVSVPRKANPQAAIMHNKFVVLLKKDQNGEFQPQAVLTGSTNWTPGGIYGQLNVGHIVYDPTVAAIYEKYFQLLHADTAAQPLKAALKVLTPVPSVSPNEPGIWPIFSPQSDKTMLELYASVCQNATCLLVCAPFELDPLITETFKTVPPGTLHFMLLDKEGSLGKDVDVIEGEPANSVSVATTLTSPLHDFQNRLLFTAEHFHHPGIHIHSKFIIADPFSDNPILVTGSANFSANSTLSNDSNSLLIRGNTDIVDIYTTEFMRMFEQYHFRGILAKAKAKATQPGAVSIDQSMSLTEDDHWSDDYYKENHTEALDRQIFAGTLSNQ